jgi:hypothetical protein
MSRAEMRHESGDDDDHDNDDSNHNDDMGECA